MEHFPDFMKNAMNRIDPRQQNTADIEGYYYEGRDGSQAAFWECRSDRVSREHAHDFDEYMVCVSGEYVACLDGREVRLKPGDELFIPRGTVQRGTCRAGTRTIHFFGGKRVVQRAGS
ncbi:MAG TPA: cupin domain-containing protein [Candidatus Aminicenantes bacterium]|nr:cupin domain-containing protein [Candidatus Aminicenantes bacterium]